MEPLRDALKALNDAAYAAALAARKSGSPIADELKRIALRSDEMVDDMPPKDVRHG